MFFFFVIKITITLPHPTHHTHSPTQPPILTMVQFAKTPQRVLPRMRIRIRSPHDIFAPLAIITNHLPFSDICFAVTFNRRTHPKQKILQTWEDYKYGYRHEDGSLIMPVKHPYSWPDTVDGTPRPALEVTDEYAFPPQTPPRQITLVIDGAPSHFHSHFLRSLSSPAKRTRWFGRTGRCQGCDRVHYGSCWLNRQWKDDD